MGETCEICGLELASVETRNLLHAGELVRYGEYRGKCVRDASCLQRGYEREKARAEKAEANTQTLIDRAWKAEAALAAARRECEGLRVERDHLRAATANANKQTADLNALRLKQDEELVALRGEVRSLREVLAHNNAAELRRVIDAEKHPFTQEWVDKMHRSWVDAKQKEAWRADRAEAALSVFRDAMVRIRERSNHGDFPEAMKIADATLAALAAPAAGEEGKCSWSGYTDSDLPGRCVLTAGHACPHQPEPTTGEEES